MFIFFTWPKSHKSGQGPLREIKFGKLPYNDLVLSKNDFSIEKLVRHTGYKPVMSYEETVKDLYKSLFN